MYPVPHTISCLLQLQLFYFFFFNDTATTEIYTLSLHDALPISGAERRAPAACGGREQERQQPERCGEHGREAGQPSLTRSEEHTSELQSHSDLVCRLLLEKKKKKNKKTELIKSKSKSLYKK